MVWKRSVSWLASGAAATVGLVWLTRLFRRKSAEREEWDSPPLEAAKGAPAELPKAALSFPDDVEDDLMAADDARRDIGEDPLDLDTENQPEDVETPDGAETVHAQERPLVQEEPYDAVDADDLGTEWLFRATESHPAERTLTPEELAERAAAEGRFKP